MKFLSIRLKIILLVLLMALPIVLMGAAGSLYYQDVIKKNIQDKQLGSAKTISALTSDYMDNSKHFLQSIADRRLVVKAYEGNDRSFLLDMVKYVSGTEEINNAYFTDSNGTVIESSANIRNYIGGDYSNRSYVIEALRTGNPVIGDAEPGFDGHPMVPIGVPVKDENGTALGVLVGTISLHDFSGKVKDAIESDYEHAYLVNRTSHIMMHSDEEYESAMTDFSAVPVVQRALHGETGVTEHYSPEYSERMISAYAPVESLGWGVVLAIPMAEAYQPVWNATWWIAWATAAFTLFAVGIGLYLGNSLANPIANLSEATKKLNGGEGYRKLLPLKRNDEIGELARSFDRMVGDLKREADAREQAIEELEAAKAEAELYVDLMGHDINNMNQSAIGYLEMALEKLETFKKLGEDDRLFLEKPVQAIANSSKLIGNVKKLQRLLTEGVKTKPVDLQEIYAELKTLSYYTDDRDVTLNIPNVPHYQVEANELLKDVFINLITNAIKHSYEDKPVTIDVRVEPETEGGRRYYKCVVEDNGPGVPDGLKDKLFYRFQRGDTMAHGKGLGLFLVRTLVEGYGGRVWVEDRVPGDHTKGARFVVRLPAAEK